MTKYRVQLLSTGGHRIDPIVVEATSPDKAKELAVTMANAQAKAKNQSYVFKTTAVNQV
jgi:hypothetical protein